MIIFFSFVLTGPLCQSAFMKQESGSHHESRFLAPFGIGSVLCYGLSVKRSISLDVIHGHLVAWLQISQISRSLLRPIECPVLLFQESGEHVADDPIGGLLLHHTEGPY